MKYKITSSEAARIMTEAHILTRRALERRPGADYSATLKEALKIAHSEDGKTAREIWESYSDTEKARALSAMTFFEYRRREARYNRKLNCWAGNVFKWVDTKSLSRDLDTVRNEAFCVLYELFSKPQHEEKPLGRLLSHAVQLAAQRIQREVYRLPSGLKPAGEDENGDPMECLQLVNVWAEAPAPAPDRFTVVRDMIESAVRDEVDRTIIAALAAGYPAREIARRVGVSHTAINRRVKAIRERHEDTPPEKAPAPATEARIVDRARIAQGWKTPGSVWNVYGAIMDKSRPA